MLAPKTMTTSRELCPAEFRKIVDTRSMEAVQQRVSQAYKNLYPLADQLFISRAFGLAYSCFDGLRAGYLPIDARYHDWEHTLQGTLAFAVLLEGRVEAKAAPPVPQELGELGFLAILLHDTGYLKRVDDPEGTGAKYTFTHVLRSCDFAEALLRDQGYTPQDIRSVQNMIRCTGVGLSLNAISFRSEEEKLLGFALGTSDLLGQMAAPDYIEKLPILFDEFLESARYNEGKGGPPLAFSSAQDLRSKTPQFWRNYVRPRIDRDFMGLYRFLARPAPDGPNPYLDAIEANIAHLEHQLEAAA